ncbi:PhoH family protein [Brevibacterium otitidis]|uniref:PhoH-like protein n=1 Tax=Brevibacterium otitidis TaxID=53364 RepID=A0ABV5X2Z9_9MICO|nr:PhoH family protein [Brevibacterium otitidis]
MHLTIPENIDPVALFGPAEANLRTLEELAPDVDIHCRQHEMTLSGPEAAVGALVTTIGELKKLVAGGQLIDPDAVRRVHTMEPEAGSAAQVLSENILSSRGRTVRPKTYGQHQYVSAIRSHTITFGLGPAGTGKTYLAMAMAVNALQNKAVSRIILTRPAVEAGENLGFLPGTLDEKIDPYVRPLYDALHDMIEPDRIRMLLDSGTIEVAPLAYMRGRTLNDSFIILDEAQNTTFEQMKMFLTRLGFGSRMVVTGDTSQVDLPGATRSGLVLAQDILGHVDDIRFCRLTSKDVVRHDLVSAIVDAYDLWSGREAAGAGRKGR